MELVLYNKTQQFSIVVFATFEITNLNHAVIIVL
jgi:hypothetical protein